MLLRTALTITTLLACIAGNLGGCQCRQDIAAGSGPELDTPIIADQRRDTPKPICTFPDSLRTENIILNQFIENSLLICARGDYDGFRQLFGTDYRPPGLRDFERIWQAVERIDVEGVYRDPAHADHYYVYAKVHRRIPDRKQRTMREAVVMAYLEAGHWRMGNAPREAVNKILTAHRRAATQSAPAT